MRRTLESSSWWSNCLWSGLSLILGGGVPSRLRAALRLLPPPHEDDDGTTSLTCCCCSWLLILSLSLSLSLSLDFLSLSLSLSLSLDFDYLLHVKVSNGAPLFIVQCGICLMFSIGALFWDYTLDIYIYINYFYYKLDDLY